MLGSQRPKWGIKAGAAALTVAAHVFFLVLLLLEKRFAPREPPLPEHPAGQWITLTLPPLPLPPVAEPVEESASPRPGTPPPRPSLPDRPSTAITLPATAPVAPATSPEASAPPAPPSVDWHAQASELAARYAEQAENPATFSGPLQVMREPCKPRQSSFWPKKKEDKDDAPRPWSQMGGPTTMVGGMPIGANGALGGGAVGSAGITIPLGKPEPNKHLFDDMKAGKTPVSSVPHHEKCD